MNTHTFLHPATGCTIHLHDETPAGAIIRAARIIPNAKEWTFDGRPLLSWVEGARLVLAP